MSYVLTYQFGSSLNVGLAVAGNHKIRLSLAFTVVAAGTNSTRFCTDYGLYVKSHGSLNIGRELDDNLLTVGQYSFSIHDSQDYLYDLLFDTAELYDRKALVTLEVAYSSAPSTYVMRFSGNLVTPIDYDPDSKTFEFVASPRTDQLKSIVLHDDSAERLAYNPLNYTITTYSGAKGKTYSLFTDNKKIVDVIHDCFKKINASCSLTVQHSWDFISTKDSTAYSINDLYVGITTALHPNWLGQTFGTGNVFYNIENLDDLVKKVAFAFFSMIGMLDNNRVIIKELFVYNSGNTQTLGTVKKFKKSYKTDPIDHVMITSRLYGKNIDNASGYDEKFSKIFYGRGKTNTRKGANVIDEQIVFWQDATVGNGYSDLFMLIGGTPYAIESVSRTDRRSGLFAQFLASSYYLLRQQNGETKVDSITAQGIGYDFMKDFAYGGRGYQILSMTEYFDKNETEFDAIDCAFVEDNDTQEDEDAPNLRLSNILPSGYYKDYTFVKSITYLEANDGSVDILNINADQQVMSITVIIDKTTAFDNLTAMTISDNDGTLIQSSEIIWDTPNQRIETFIFKNYTSQQTIKANFTGTATEGSCNVIVKLLSRD
jgi:hypothetical protein